MFAFAVPFIASRLGLPSGLVKVLLPLLAVCLFVIVMALVTWQVRVYAEHQTEVAVTLASNGAKAEVAAEVNAASEAVVRAQHEAQAREMAKLADRDASNAAMWSTLDQTLSSIPETPDVAPASVPLLLGPVSPVVDLSARRPRAAPARLQPVPAAPALRPHVPGFAGLVAADAAADRLLERSSALDP